MRRAIPLLVGVVLLTACSHDGRALRTPGAGQNQSIFTPTTSTTVAPGIGTNAPTTGRAAGRLVLGLPWADDNTIAAVYTCKGAGTSPLVTWAEAPAGAKEMALTVIDDTAGGFVHWVIAGIDPGAGSIGAATVPPGSVQGLNGAGTKGWYGPCPPAGTTHHYRFTLYALSAPSGLTDGADSKAALATVQRNVLALDVVFGLFST